MYKSSCPLCKSHNIARFSKDKKRIYFNCINCKSIFVPHEYHLREQDEKKRYELHTNSPNNSKYITFLSRIVKPVLEKTNPNSRGLDFGCGPGPILKNIFKTHSINIEEYDPFFKDTKNLLDTKWDFIISTEVVEHLKYPLEELYKMWNILKPGGYLFIMTQLYQPNTEFKSWYYKGDPTHIIFYTKESFKWINEKLNSSLEFIGNDIIILKKS